MQLNFKPIIIIICIIFSIIIAGLILLNVKANKNKDCNRSENKAKKVIGIILFILSGLPIITYPFVLIANIMQLAAFGQIGENSNLIVLIGAIFFLIITTIYPLVYIVCVIIFYGKKGKSNIFIPLIPVCILLIIGGVLSGSTYSEHRFNSDGNYRITNVEIFKNTPAWELALAVKKEKVESIQSIIKEAPEALNYQDPKYGATPLLWAIGMGKYKSAEALLKCGADSNIPGKGELGTPLLVAVEDSWESKYSDDPKLINLLLKYKADPNKGYVGEDTVMIVSGTSPLLMAAYGRLEKTKALVEGGADINYKNKYGRTAAINALIEGSIYKKTTVGANIAHYLIVEKKANVTEPYYSGDIMADENKRKKYYPVDLLRDWVSDLNSKEFEMKMEVVKEFSRQGVSYADTKISDDRLKGIIKIYPNNWQEYIKQY